MTQFAGLAPTTLGHRAEPILLWVEETPGVGNFEPTPFLVDASVQIGSNAGLPRATVRVGLGAPPGVTPVGVNFLRDWQVPDKNNTPANLWELLGAGRRFQVRTVRQNKQEDWCLFEGFIDEITLGWSGAAKHHTRYANVSGVSTFAAGDRTLGQALLGQWRRSRTAFMALRTNKLAPEAQECVQVTSLPCVFNPDGRGNCSATPLYFNSSTAPENLVYVFTDEDDPTAVPWTYARVFRYLQWAAIQPLAQPDATQLQNPIDLKNFSVGPHWSHQWTAYNLWHSKRQSIAPYKPLPPGSGPNLDELIEPLLEQPASQSPTPDLQTLLRPPTSLVLDHMSIAEALAFTSHQADMLLAVEHVMSLSGQVLTYPRFSVRSTVIRDEVETPNPGSVRRVPLYMSSDRRDLEGGGQSRDTPQLFRDDAFTEGSIALDLSGRGIGVLLFGDPSVYEMTPFAMGMLAYTLLPGWEPESEWDVDPSNSTAVQAAIDKIGTPAWVAKYAGGQSAIDYQAVGRSWVLNEDGFFWDAAYYRYGSSFWADPKRWEPYGFATAGGVKDMESRGDGGWCVRRRKFLPVNAWTPSTTGGRELQCGIFVEVSFDSGTTWWWTEQLGVNVTPKDDRCGVYFGVDDLSRVAPPPNDPASPVEPTNYVKAYIQGKLRVRVTALVEGDDALRAWSLPGPDDGGAPFWYFVSRRGKAPRTIRTQPPPLSGSAANNVFMGPFPPGTIVGEDRNFQAQANAAVGKIHSEIRGPRWAGQATIPWLWRDGFGPSDGYRIGDEIDRILTGDAKTLVSFGEGKGFAVPRPRVSAITYRISDEGEQSTTLSLESFELNAELLIGRMGPKEERGEPV